jgi:hypothetical protein
MQFRNVNCRHSLTLASVSMVALVCSTALAAPKPIKFQSGAVDFSASQKSQPVQIQSIQSGEHVVVQFDQPVSPEKRAELAAAGITLLDSLGADAYFARIDHPQTAATSLTGTVTRSIDVTWKQEPALAFGQTPQHAILDDTVPANPLVAAYVMFHRDVDVFADGMQTAALFGADIRDVVWANNSLVIEIPLDQLHALSADNSVQWVEFAKPKFGNFNVENRALTGADQAQTAPYNLDGTGVNVLVYDAGTARASHQDFSGRLSVHDASGQDYHATHVAGTIGGDGTASGGTQRGMAPNVTLFAYGFDYDGSGIFLYSNPGDMQNDYNQAINTLGADISNNSIGSNVESNFFACSIQGDYGVTSNLIDSIVRGSLGDPFRIVWAAGNERQGTRCNVEGFGDYYSVPTPSGAKNHISVGALNANDDSMTSFSSWGPTDDGRMIPHVSAPGCQSGGDGGVTSTGDSSTTQYITLCGTSMASPTVCGISALILQDYRSQYPNDPDPRNSTLKALLAHGAVDLGNTGPDYQYGYGSVRVTNSIDLLRSGNLLEDELDQGITLGYDVVVGSGDSELKITIAWDDYPGTPNVNPALVNDLDLRVYDPSNNLYYPWSLNPGNPGAAAVQTAANRIDNIEQVLVNNPTPGTWRVEVVGHDVPEGPQPFSLVSSSIIAFAPTLSIGLVDDLPLLIDPNVVTTLDVRIRPIIQNLIGSSPTLHYRYDGGVWYTAPLTLVGGEIYQAELPPAACGAAPEFFFSAEGDISGLSYYPIGAPTSALSVPVGTEFVVFGDDFETDTGWTVIDDIGLIDGTWDRGVPVAGGLRGDPAVDYDGSGSCYLTDNAELNSDVDGGITWLISPTIDMSIGGVEMEFAIWYTNDFGADPDNDLFNVDISDDGGSSWNTFLTLGPDTSNGWQFFSYLVDEIDGISPGANMKLRFECSDLNDPSVVEAGVDAVRLFAPGCFVNVEDCNGNGIQDSDDLTSGRASDLNASGTIDACDGYGDANDDGLVNFADFVEFPTCLMGPDMPANAACLHAFDRDIDADVDMTNFATFQTLIDS